MRSIIIDQATRAPNGAARRVRRFSIKPTRRDLLSLAFALKNVRHAATKPTNNSPGLGTELVSAIVLFLTLYREGTSFSIVLLEVAGLERRKSTGVLARTHELGRAIDYLKKFDNALDESIIDLLILSVSTPRSLRLLMMRISRNVRNRVSL